MRRIFLSWKFDFFHLSMGFLSALIVTFFNYTIRNHFYKSEEKENQRKLNIIKFVFMYVPWLFYEIFISSIHVALVIINPKKHLDR